MAGGTFCVGITRNVSAVRGESDFWQLGVRGTIWGLTPKSTVKLDETLNGGRSIHQPLDRMVLIDPAAWLACTAEPNFYLCKTALDRHGRRDTNKTWLTLAQELQLMSDLARYTVDTRFFTVGLGRGAAV